MRKSIPLLALTVALTACTTPDPGPATVDVTVIGVNDLHGYLEASNFAGVMIPDPNDATKQIRLAAGGLDVIGGYLDAERVRNKNLLFVGNGDLIGASPIASSLLRDEPTILALNKLGMTVSSLGNHEFDQGLKELLRMQNGGCDSNDPTKACKFENPYPGAAFKYLAANVLDKTSGKPVFPAYKVETVGSAKIAFIGAVTKSTPTIVSPEGVSTLNFADEADSINSYIPELKAQGVDAIIALVHEGGTATEKFDTPGCATLKGAVVDIVNKLDPAVSAVISGHTHQGYNCTVNGRIVLQGDAYGHLLQRLDMTIDRQQHKVTSLRASNVVMDGRSIAKNAEVTALVGKAKQLTKAVQDSPVGTIATPSISRSNNAAGESALGDVVADSQLAATRDRGAVIAFMNPGGIRADLTASGGGTTVTFGDLYTVQPFGNTLAVMDLTGAQIKELLEAQFDNPAAGQNRILQVSQGFTYSYDSTAAKGSKVDPASIKLNGVTIDPAKTYRVTMNSFLSTGGDNFATFQKGTNVLQLANLVDVDALSAYVKANPGLAGGQQDRIIKTK